MAYGQALKALMIAGYLMGHSPNDDHPFPSFKLYSPAFNNAGIIPNDYTCRAGNISLLPLAWQGVPLGTKSLALLLVDQDVPRHNWYHWAVYNIPPTEMTNPLERGAMAENSWGQKTYQAPCSVEGEHHYMTYLFALDTVLPQDASQSAIEMRRLMRNHIIAKAELMGRVVATPTG